ncbi:MAG: hypothetical protein ABWY77_07430 [Acidimicrobiia bacterium]
MHASGAPLGSASIQLRAATSRRAPFRVADRAEPAITDGALTIAVTTLFVHAQRDAA